ncbi:MAG: cytochrome c family protein [Erythrobacter sp.]
MNKISAILALSSTALLLVSCGESASPDPVEQIVVADPGEGASAAADTDDVTLADAAGMMEEGRKAFAVCSSCHSVEKGEASSIGPNLYGVVGRKAGSMDDFKYSEAMTGSGLTWDEGTLDTYLANPSAMVPGTTMMAGAVRDEDKRAAIIVYLASESD